MFTWFENNGTIEHTLMLSSVEMVHLNKENNFETFNVQMGFGGMDIPKNEYKRFMDELQDWQANRKYRDRLVDTSYSLVRRKNK